MTSEPLSFEAFLAHPGFWYLQFQNLAALQPWDDQALHEQKDVCKRLMDATILSANADRLSGGIWQEGNEEAASEPAVTGLVKSVTANWRWLALASVGCQVFYAPSARWLADAQVKFFSAMLFSDSANGATEGQPAALSQKLPTLPDFICDQPQVAQDQLDQAIANLSDDEQRLLTSLARTRPDSQVIFPLTYKISLVQAASQAGIEWKHAQILEHTTIESLRRQVNFEQFWQPVSSPEESSQRPWILLGHLAEYAAFSENARLSEQLLNYLINHLWSALEIQRLTTNQAAALCYLGQALLRNNPQLFGDLLDRLQKTLLTTNTADKTFAINLQEAQPIGPNDSRNWPLAGTDYRQILVRLFITRPLEATGDTEGDAIKAPIEYLALSADPSENRRQWQQKYGHYQPRLWLLPIDYR